MIDVPWELEWRACPPLPAGGHHHGARVHRARRPGGRIGRPCGAVARQFTARESLARETTARQARGQGDPGQAAGRARHEVRPHGQGRAGGQPPRAGANVTVRGRAGRSRRGIPRLAGKNGSGRGPSCQHTMLVRQNGRLVSHKTCGQHCTGSGEKPADPNLAGGAAADSLNGRVRGCLLPGEEYADDAQTAIGGEASAVHG